ncbi:transporter substrate-binding domain-containing protein [bacterium]|nr:transporter substrate-binding domain-containing protein [bacterium]
MRLLVFLLFAAVLFPAGAHGRLLALSASDAPPYSTPDGSGIADRIVREALRRAGVTAKFVTAPSERSLVNANEGIVDGEYLRIAGLEKKYPNLVMVPEPICEYEFAAFAKDRGIGIKGWKSLRPHNVGYITGWKILEENVTGVKSLTTVNNEDVLFELLRSGRADVVIFERFGGDAYLKRTGTKDIHPLSPSLARRRMHLYLNRRNASLVPVLAKALGQMKQDGTWRRIVSSAQGAGK